MSVHLDPGVMDRTTVPAVRWHVLAVVPHSQLRVCERAKDFGIETYVPMSKTLAVVRGRKFETVRPLMPGYIFTSLSVVAPRFDLFQNDDLGSTEQILGCLGFVADANGPRAAVADDIIEDLRIRERNGEFDLTGKSEDERHLVARWVKRGALVRFVKGPFTGYLGVIDRVLGPSLVRINVTIFGRDTPIDAPMDWIERVR